MRPLQIVWFKRDLRIVDHRPLTAAAERGPVLPLYVVEPEWWQQPDASERQWLFCRESLLELRQALADLGQPLVVRSGDVVQVLERARRQFGIDGLWSHEETGNGWTYQRDKRVGGVFGLQMVFFLAAALMTRRLDVVGFRNTMKTRFADVMEIAVD